MAVGTIVMLEIYFVSSRLLDECSLQFSPISLQRTFPKKWPLLPCYMQLRLHWEAFFMIWKLLCCITKRKWDFSKPKNFSCFTFRGTENLLKMTLRLGNGKAQNKMLKTIRVVSESRLKARKQLLESQNMYCKSPCAKQWYSLQLLISSFGALLCPFTKFTPHCLRISCCTNFK